MKFYSTRQLRDPRTGAYRDYDIFLYACALGCEERGVIGAPVNDNGSVWKCHRCGRKYQHYRPAPGRPGVPDLVPLLELYGKQTPRDAFPGFKPTQVYGTVILDPEVGHGR